jgi:hypothetical protein
VKLGTGEKCGEQRQQGELQEEAWLEETAFTVSGFLRTCEELEWGRVAGSTLP